jgi:endo-alpha-1,4-polygalactosaminidase (GH114 family)
MRLGGDQLAGWATIGKACFVALALLFAWTHHGYAQTSTGTTSKQAATPAPEPIDPFAPGIIIDFREHMRLFVQSISDLAHSLNPNFVVIARDGLALVGKPDPADDQVIFPAQSYMRAIDGVMETNLLDQTVTNEAGKLDPELQAAVKRRNDDWAIAREAGLTVFSLDYATEPQAVDKLYADLLAKGTIPFVGEAPALNSFPATPKTAINANPLSITSAAEVRNYLYIANPQSFGSTGEFLQTLRSTNHDMVVIDVFHGRKPLTKDEVFLLKYKNLGAPRLVLAQLDISTAAPFMYYWKPGWIKGNPPFLYAPMREDPDRIRTIYWDPEWQNIIIGGYTSYLYGIMDLGFDGVVLTGLDAWRYFENGGEAAF